MFVAARNSPLLQSEQRAHDERTMRLLECLASGKAVTQRSMASSVGVALGLTNLLVRRLVRQGYVRIARIGPRHVRYFVTPEGFEALGQATLTSLNNTVRLYTQTRDHIGAELNRISANLGVEGRAEKQIVFYGAGDAGEIAFVSLQSTDLGLAGVVDDARGGHFFGFPIHHSRVLSRGAGAALFQDCHIFVTSIRQGAAMRERLLSDGIDPRRVSSL